MNMIDRLVCVLIAALMLAGLSCGGGNNTVAGGGIGGTGVTSAGQVTAIGSIWVNGVEYDTRTADVYLDNSYIGSGDQAIIDHVDVGRVVLVRGSLLDTDSGTADEVYFTSTVLGLVDAIQTIDDHTTKLTILSQTIIVDERTRFEDVTLDILAAGNIVDVSGHLDDTGAIYASLLKKTSDSAPIDDPYAVTGTVSGLDTGGKTFTINSLEVDYSQADVGTDIENGRIVFVRGDIESGSAVFIADSVAPYLNLEVIQDEAIEIEGFVGAAIENDQFPLNGFTIEATAATEYIGGTEEDILPGVIVEVEGYADSDVIIAEKIKFSPLFRAESDLGQKDGDAFTLELDELEEIEFQTNELTRYLGLAESFEALTPGDHLVIKGRIVENQTVIAVQIIGLPDKDKLVLRGTVSAINAPILTINGVSIDTDTIPPNGFYTDEDTSISQDDFFQLLQEDDRVEARGELSGGSAVWEKITLGLIQ